MRNILVFLVVIVLYGCTTLDQYIPSMPTSILSRNQASAMSQPSQPGTWKAAPPSTRSQPAPKSIDAQNKPFLSNSSFPPVKVALLVPLSGEYQTLGKNLLDAAQLALFSLNEDNLILLPIDTKGSSAAGTIDAANKAIAEGAKIILGPIFSGAAKAIAPLARDHNISVVSFSNDKTLANSGVFAIGFLPEQQIKRIAEFAMEQGIRDFVTVLPSDIYGETAAKELRETVGTNSQATVLSTEMFRTNAQGQGVDLNEHLSLALNTAMRTPSPKNPAEPISFPRGLLIPQGGKQLDQITALLPQLQHDPKKVQLLGNAQWYTPEALTNSALEGAWFSGPPSDRHQQFEQNFQKVFGYKPITLASLAYDGIALSATLARISNGTDFSRESLSNPRGFVGVDGIFRFNSNGLTERGLAVMAIQGGRFKVVSPAPQNFF